MNSSGSFLMFFLFLTVLVSFASPRPQALCPAGLDCASLCPNFPFCHNNHHSGEGFGPVEHARRISVLDAQQAALRVQEELIHQAELQVIAQQEASIRETEVFALENPRQTEALLAVSPRQTEAQQEAHIRQTEKEAEAHREAHFKATKAHMEALRRQTEAHQAAFAAAAAANGVAL